VAGLVGATPLDALTITCPSQLRYYEPTGKKVNFDRRREVTGRGWGSCVVRRRADLLRLPSAAALGR
jgi:hypothetical protein